MYTIPYGFGSAQPPARKEFNSQFTIPQLPLDRGAGDYDGNVVFFNRTPVSKKSAI
tara:strand:- start:1424 stop:1591 length:168 start_codon:yes stop_codon:yes gene_type:complete